ncbi:MAG: crotonase/enoyl-CoA hydratase family protein [Alphaproteobacteria bacterium]|nr:MAG: crotonase/enoyl-CoA hydratase family protein [Alphaproteobacteria bacterium]
MSETLSIETNTKGVAVVRLARPEKHNALSAEMIDALAATATRLGRDPAVRVVVLTGTGPTFCAGGDLGWMQAQMEADRAARVREARRLAEMLQALNTMPKPLIARVQGNAFGGGVGLIAVADVAIAAADATLGLTETRLGLVPATISPYVIARMGEGKARRVFMSARLFPATEAVSLDLVARAVPAEDLDQAVEEEIAPYFSAAPGAVGAAKRLARRLGPRIDESVIAETIETLADQWETEEAREGISAFFARRAPSWKL